MATVDTIDFNSTLSEGECNKLVDNIIDCLGTYIDFRVSQECNIFRAKHPDNDLTIGNVPSRFTIMLLTEDEYEERCPEDFIAEVRRSLGALIYSAVLENKTYDLLKFAIETFSEHCVICLDGKPVKDGEFITIEEARRECNTID